MFLSPHLVKGWRLCLSSHLVLHAVVQELVESRPIVAELLPQLSLTVLDCWRVTRDFRHGSGLMKASFDVDVSGSILANVWQLDSLELRRSLACSLTLLLRFRALLVFF